MAAARAVAANCSETLLYWKAKVTLDANGEARVQMPLNDSLTSFRIVAVASAGPDLFGTGQAVIRSSQDLMLMSGLLGCWCAKVTACALKHHAAQRVSRRTEGRCRSGRGGRRRQGARWRASRSRSAPGQAQELGWDFQVPLAASSLSWQLDANAFDPVEAWR
ncbi:hypothetical protein LP420_07145 [Massilia sp. B-10]|nr:hypothetical protein LP420_07145 [Massilia sp. B-10]